MAPRSARAFFCDHDGHGTEHCPGLGLAAARASRLRPGLRAGLARHFASSHCRPAFVVGTTPPSSPSGRRRRWSRAYYIPGSTICWTCGNARGGDRRIVAAPRHHRPPATVRWTIALIGGGAPGIMQMFWWRRGSIDTSHGGSGTRSSQPARRREPSSSPPWRSSFRPSPLALSRRGCSPLPGNRAALRGVPVA